MRRTRRKRDNTMKIILIIIGCSMAIALIIAKDTAFLVPGILCYGFAGMIEAIEKLGEKKEIK